MRHIAKSRGSERLAEWKNRMNLYEVSARLGLQEQ